MATVWVCTDWWTLSLRIKYKLRRKEAAVDTLMLEKMRAARQASSIEVLNANSRSRSALTTSLLNMTAYPCRRYPGRPRPASRHDGYSVGINDARRISPSSHCSQVYGLTPISEFDVSIDLEFASS